MNTRFHICNYNVSATCRIQLPSIKYLLYFTYYYMSIYYNIEIDIKLLVVIIYYTNNNKKK